MVVLLKAYNLYKPILLCIHRSPADPVRIQQDDHVCTGFLNNMHVRLKVRSVKECLTLTLHKGLQLDVLAHLTSSY